MPPMTGPIFDLDELSCVSEADDTEAEAPCVREEMVDVDVVSPSTELKDREFTNVYYTGRDEQNQANSRID